MGQRNRTMSSITEFCQMESDNDGFLPSEIMDELINDMAEAEKQEIAEYKEKPEFALEKLQTIFNETLEIVDEGYFVASLRPKAILEILDVKVNLTWNTTYVKIKASVVAEDNKKYIVECFSHDIGSTWSEPSDYESDYELIACLI